MLAIHDTIAAVATPPGEGAIAIVRVSGREALAVADRVFRLRRDVPSHQRTHTARHGTAIDPSTQEPLDDALLLVFRAPHSYTGEDSFEIQCHGGPTVVRRVLQAVHAAGARPALPGEFSQRAFLAGRMDLAQAEAVCDIVRAGTDAARRTALLQQTGALSTAVRNIRSVAMDLLASVEAATDFSDEVGNTDLPAMVAALDGQVAVIDHLLAGAAFGHLVRDGLRLAIAGRPNVGKSSLLNALVGRERAIVTPIPGTTRDTIEERIDIAGVPVTLTDMAGIRDTSDPVERMGVERAQASAAAASLVLFVTSAPEGWTHDDQCAADAIQGLPVVWTANKVDLLDQTGVSQSVVGIRAHAGNAPVVPVSALTGEGIDRLRETISQRISAGLSESESVLVSNVRHVYALEKAREHLCLARETAGSGMPADLTSVDLRGAAQALGEITGDTLASDLIDRIFRKFCIGK